MLTTGKDKNYNKESGLQLKGIALQNNDNKRHFSSFNLENGAKQKENRKIGTASLQLEKTHLIISSPTKMQNNDLPGVNAKQSRANEYTSCNPR